MYTDGGPDHNLTFLSVQLALIALFIHFDLDMLQAVRTAPYRSWKNPCERVNCILNLGLQAVGLMRMNMEGCFERMITGCNSIRQAVEKSPLLKDALKDSIEPVKTLISSQFMRLSLKGKSFRCFVSASDHEIEGFFDHLHDIEPSLTMNDRKKECLSRLYGLQQFMAHSCHIRKYVFSIKKCGKMGCSICSAPRLPSEIFKQLSFLPDPVATGEHYKPFEEVYGTLTTEKDRPSMRPDEKKGHGIPFSPNAQTARRLVLCSECLKPRVVYVQHKLSYHDEPVLDRVLDSYLYTCGSSLDGLKEEIGSSDHPSVQDLFSRVYTRKNLTCEAPVEIPYYSSQMFLSVCTHCACEWTDTEEGKYPICDYCKQQGHSPLLKRKRKQKSA